MKNMLLGAMAIGAAGLSVAIPTDASAASLLGETVGIEYLFPNDATSFQDYGNILVGAGVEANLLGAIDLDIGANTITVSAIVGGFFFPASFNGWLIADVLGNIGNFTGLALVSSTFANVTSSFNANEIFLNFGASEFNEQGSTAVFSYDVAAAVPLPATLPLLLVAGGALAFLRRSRRAS